MHRHALLIAATLGVLTAQRLPSLGLTTDERVAKIELRLKQSPKDAAILNELAGEFLQKMRETADGGYLDRADRIVKAILESDASNYDARRRSIEIGMQRHHFEQVVNLTDSLARERPKDAAVWGLRGDALMEMGEYDRAADAYQTMVDLRPNLASYNRIAFYRFVTGDAQGAISVMRKAIGIGSPFPENVAWCLTDLGQMLLKTGATDEAEAAFREALRVFPGYHAGLAGLGRVFAAQGRNAEAVEYFRRAQLQAPLPEYAGWLVKLYRRLGQQELAKKQLAMLDVADALGKAAGETANRNLALAYADLDYRTSRALELARAEFAVRRDVYTYDALAWALFKNGKTAEALSVIDKALAQKTPEPSFHEHAAQIFAATGRTDEARR
jgi:Flp pilus assembly protein TadD